MTNNDVYKLLRHALMHDSAMTPAIVAEGGRTLATSRVRGWSYSPDNRRYVEMTDEDLRAYCTGLMRVLKDSMTAPFLRLVDSLRQHPELRSELIPRDGTAHRGVLRRQRELSERIYSRTREPISANAKG